MRSLATCLLVGFAAFVGVGWAAGALWTPIIGSSDLAAVRELAGQRSSALTDLVRVLTWSGSGLVLVPAAAICVLALGRAGLRREAAAVALSLAGAILIYDAVKPLVVRARPPTEHLQAVTGASFPSGHATQASAFCLSLILALRATRIARPWRLAATGALLALPAIVALSRVYLGVHYPGDVAAGLLLGGGWAVYVRRCLRDAAPDLRSEPPS